MTKKTVYGQKGNQYETLTDVRQASGMSMPEQPSVELLRDSGISVEEIEVEDDLPTPEEISQQQMIADKTRRDKAMKLLKITSDGVTLDADELSQSRMTNVIITALAKGQDLNAEKVLQTLTDNTSVEIPIRTLVNVMSIAQQTQTIIWQTPYSGIDVEDLELPEGAFIDFDDLNGYPKPVITG